MAYGGRGRFVTKWVRPRGYQHPRLTISKFFSPWKEGHRFKTNPRRHGVTPLRSSLTEAFHDFSRFWPPFSIRIPTELGEIPQRVREPNLRSVFRFIRALSHNHCDRKLGAPEVAERYIACKDLNEVRKPSGVRCLVRLPER